MAKKKPATCVPVDAHKHVADKRRNIPTRETADITCGFIDTDYDGQSFFVRHAYSLCGGRDSKDGP
jgi:hypothetical protein